MIPDGESTTTKFIIEAQFKDSVCGDGDERWVAFPASYATHEEAVETLTLMMDEHAARLRRRHRGDWRNGMFRVVRIDTLTMRHLVALPPRVSLIIQ